MFKGKKTWTEPDLTEASVAQAVADGIIIFLGKWEIKHSNFG